MRSAAWLLFVLLGLSSAAACAERGASRDPLSADSLRAVAVGRFDFESGSPADPALAPEELSGIAWVDGDRYLAVGDAHAAVQALTIRIDPRTGEVRSAVFAAPVALRDSLGGRLPEPQLAEDREGIAWDPERREIWIANEQTGPDRSVPSIERFSMDGNRTGLLRVGSDPSLAPFLRPRANRTFEALARAADGSSFWTANEDALIPDGPAASDTAGAVVRLLRVGPDLRPLAQFAYPLDAWSRRIRNPSLVAGREINGVSAMAALPDGRLLVLERAFGGDIGGNASLRSRLYLVDVSGATDVGGEDHRGGLAGARYRPARKALLWETGWGLTNSNFEGMTLGPTLADGSRVVILIADNNGGSAQALFTLRLKAR